MKRFSEHIKRYWWLILGLSPIGLILLGVTYSVTVDLYNDAQPTPSGSYKEIANLRNLRNPVAVVVENCMSRNSLPYRITKPDYSLQVQESILEKSIRRCYPELRVAHMDDKSGDWERTYSRWRGF